MDTRASEQVFPLSFSQESLWFIHQLDPSIPAYNTVFLFRITGSLDISTLEQSLNEIVRRHNSLRSIFPDENGTPRQVVLPFEPRSLPVLDCSDVPESGRLEKAFQFAVDKNNQPIDIVVGPLFQAFLLAFAEQEHVLAIHVHHIVTDSWSDTLIVKELAAFYRAISEGESPALSDLKMQFGDYVLWQREWMQGERLKEYLGYWEKKLGGGLPVLELPLDHPRPRLQTFRGKRVSRSLPPELVASLKSFCRQERVTLFMLLLTAFKVLLSRYTGQEDVIVGSPFANRFPEETENMIGYFVNTLPLRTDLTGDPSFRDLLRRVRETVLDAIRYQALPFEYIVEHLKPERELNRTPVFQVVMNMVNVPQYAAEAGDIQIQALQYDREITPFDLILQVREPSGGLNINLTGNTDLFDQDTLERISGHFIQLLRNAIAAPETKISSLPLLARAEQAQLAAWNETFSPYPSEAGIQHLFEDRVVEIPGRPALFSDDVRLSYAELNLRANQLAHHLQSLGLRPAEPVALCVERTPDAAIGALAILKAGGAYLPIDPSYPEERMAFMLRDSRARFLLTQEPLLTDLAGLPARAICIDAPDAFSSYPAENPASSTGGMDPACIFYTSGSTGQPKGVLVPHRAISRLVLGTDYVHILPSDVFGQVSNLAFDAFTFELWGALLNGASLAFIPFLVTLSPQEYASRLNRDGVTVMFMTATLFNLMVQNTPNAFAGMRYLLVGGEQLDPEAVREVMNSSRPERLLNAYGPTETATFACTYVIDSVPETATAIPIGKPIANTTAYVLDRNLNPVPVGVAGELLIGGEAVTLGYLNQPELTAEKFIRDPFSDDPSARLYRTGDLVRRLLDGNLVFLGRLDDQVKIRGFRVEPGEVEAALKGHPAVREAVVVAQKGPQGKQLAAFYLPAESDRAVPDLRDYLKSKLPDYMIPAAMMALDKFPLTPSGKIDRLALSRLEVSVSEIEYVPPRDLVEARLADIWQRVLGLKRVGMTDNFFDVGGHSLLATRLFAEIEKEFSCALPLAALFEHGTVGEIAALIKSDPAARAWPLLIPMQKNGNKSPIFLAPGGGGGVFYLRDLVKNLGAEHPVYGLQSIQPDLRSKGLTPVPELAELYLKEIRDCQPTGPYFLLGHSNGGMIVYEIACLLRRAGEAVSLLGLLDTYPPGARAKIPLRERVLSFWQNLIDMRGAKERARYMLIRVQRFLIKQIKSTPFLGVAARVGLIPKDRMMISALAQVNYKPPYFDGTLTVFRVTERPRFEQSDPLNNWKMFAGQVDIINVPGNHKTVLSEPHVQELAKAIRECLD